MEDKEYIQLSGVQHYIFCPRQWALIHVEQQWAENVRTIDGEIMHNRADNGPERELRGDTLIIRGLRLCSKSLGISGICDVVEFHQSSGGIELQHEEGKWVPYPVEYKHGEPKENDADRVQLCLQALCLEEMLSCEIPVGSLYYGEIRRRESVLFDEILRNKTKGAVKEMHDLLTRGHTPKAKPSKACNACSLKDICVPRLAKISSVKTYIDSHIAGDDY